MLRHPAYVGGNGHPVVVEDDQGKGTFVIDNEALHDDYGFNDLNFLQVKLKDLYEVRLIVEDVYKRQGQHHRPYPALL